MKKAVFIIIGLLVLAGGALAVFHNLPERKFTRHVEKARLFIKQNNFTAARKEYEAAYDLKGGYSPYASLEVLRFENTLALGEGKIDQAIENTRHFLNQYQNNDEARMILAGLALQSGDLETAFESLDQVLHRDPVHFPARLLLAQVRGNQGRLDLAEEQLRVLQTAFPDSVDALMPLAKILLQRGSLSESRRFISEVLENNPRHTQARLLLADILLKQRKVDSAQILIKAWAAEDEDKSQDLRVRQARLLSLLDSLDAAEAILADYTDVRAENAPALSELAIIRVKQGSLDSALSIYRKLGGLGHEFEHKSRVLTHFLHMAADNPAQALEALKVIQVKSGGRNPMARNQLACYLALEQEIQAHEYIARQPPADQEALGDFVASLHPSKDFISQWALVNYYTLNNQAWWAFQTVEEMYRRWPRTRMSVDLYSQQLVSLGNPRKAIEVLEQFRPRNLGQEMALVRLYRLTGRSDRAFVLAKNLYSKEPDIQELRMMLAEMHLSRGDRNRYFLLLKEEHERNPGNLAAINNLAWEYGIERKELAKAQPFIDILEKHKKADPRILDTIGWILATNGKHEEARTHLELALHLVPDHPSFLYHLGWLEWKAGDTDKARTHLEKVAASPGDTDEKKKARALLAEIG